jgi:hypothetical protein
MQITKVSQKENRSGIPVKGWAAVEAAITAYETGGSRAAQNETAQAIGASQGGMAAAFFVVGAQHCMEAVRISAERLLAEAKAKLAGWPCFSKDYDYDGTGTAFFKTSVSIEVVDRAEEIYRLAFCAAYVGDQPEINFAKNLEVERLLNSITVEVETAVVDGGFEFDFSEIMARLDTAGLIEIGELLKGEAVAKAMMKTHYGDSDANCCLFERAGLEVWIYPGTIKRRFDYKDGKQIDTFKLEGSVLRGQLGRDYESDDENAKAAPSFRISVQSVEKNELDRTPSLWQPESQLAAVALAARIAEAFK